MLKTTCNRPRFPSAVIFPWRYRIQLTSHRYMTFHKFYLRYRKTGNKKRATCLATLLLNELNSDVARFTAYVQTYWKPDLLQHRFDVGGNRATSLFNSFCSNVARQVARFLFPVFPYFKVASTLSDRTLARRRFDTVVSYKIWYFLYSQLPDSLLGLC